MQLKYTVLFSDFQPNANNNAFIELDIVPKGSFIQNVQVCANTVFTGVGLTACVVNATFQSSLYDAHHGLNVFNHPFILPVPPIPQSRTVLLPSTSKQLIKVSVKTTGVSINALSGGACDIYFQLNTVVYPQTLDLIFKQPILVFSFKQLLSAVTGDMFRLFRTSDNTFKFFQYIDNVIDNAGIIAWLAGNTGYFANLFNQVPGGVNLRQNIQADRPIYDPVTSLITFDGVNDRIFLTAVIQVIDFFMSVRSSVDNNQIIGHATTVQSGVSRKATSVFFRNRLSQFTYTINSGGFLKTFLNSNTLSVSCFVDLIEASNSPHVFGNLNFQFSQIGARGGAGFFTGTFDELIVYDSPLSNSEMLIINSI